MLPPDNHTHTEWSWDALDGSMERSCARAVELGLPSIAFTEHADYVTTQLAGTPVSYQQFVTDEGQFRQTPVDLDGYLDCLQRCRDRFPDLRILSGVEAGEPHLFPDQFETLLKRTEIDRVLGSLHVLHRPDGFWAIDVLYRREDPAELMRDYLAEILRMVETSSLFGILAHIDYPVRVWPRVGAPFEPRDFEEEYRAVLRALAATGRALEVNTVLPLAAAVVRWWYEAGGAAVSFGSDAHRPSDLARNFADAAAMVQAQGFGPGRHPHDFWRRSG